MSGEGLMTGSNRSRRRLLRSALLGATAALTPAAFAAAPAEPTAKLSRQEALYQDDPKDMQNCAMCTLFLPPGGCKVVEGTVSPNGWCRLFDMAD
jgi:hypothetical protein